MKNEKITKVEASEVYPLAPLDETERGKVTAEEMKDATCELNNNPRNSDLDGSETAAYSTGC